MSEVKDVLKSINGKLDTMAPDLTKLRLMFAALGVLGAAVVALGAKALG